MRSRGKPQPTIPDAVPSSDLDGLPTWMAMPDSILEPTPGSLIKPALKPRHMEEMELLLHAL